MTDYDAVVLAGGAARRLGGADKPAVRVGGRSLLDRVLSACAGAGRTVVVGPRRPTARPVTWTREEPPGGGPLAGLAAGLRHVGAERVLVLSADLPFLEAEAVGALLAATGGTGGEGGGRGGPGRRGGEGAVLTDAGGREQPLVAVYGAEPLRRELGLLVAEHGTLNGLPLRLLTNELELARVHHPTAAFDCDTWEDIGTARARIRDDGSVLDEWISAVKAELGIELDVDRVGLLDLARDAAHGVARPAAPLTTFLVGYAAAQRGGGPEAVAEAARLAGELAARWAEETDAGAAGPASGSGAGPGAGPASGAPSGPASGADEPS
ncbi:NTP transferase domain-containing protein [Streptomyces cinnamoneus]|uniref:NTP transferase domain-containing protein n=1 Tax=Streptomyces cinnamoneus TaxID=53446 RepID=UPI0033CB36AD